MPGGRFFRFDIRTCVRAALGTGGVHRRRGDGNDGGHQLSGHAGGGPVPEAVGKTLARYRVTGDGPVFNRFGNRIRYRRAALDAWADARERVSTVDDGGDRPGADR